MDENARTAVIPIPERCLFGRASARKSFGKYKPVVIYLDGRTEILAKREVRGKTFDSRQEAIEFAQLIIDQRFADAVEAVSEYNSLVRTSGDSND